MCSARRRRLEIADVYHDFFIRAVPADLPVYGHPADSIRDSGRPWVSGRLDCMQRDHADLFPEKRLGEVCQGTGMTRT